MFQQQDNTKMWKHRKPGLEWIQFLGDALGKWKEHMSLLCEYVKTFQIPFMTAVS